MLPAVALLTTALPVLGAACVIAPVSEVDSVDAGPSSPPVIMSAAPSPEFSFPGPLILDRQDERTLSLTVQDLDIGDVIYARLYVDYGLPDPQPAYAECQAASTGESTRVIACPTNAICNALDAADVNDHVLSVMVADSEFLSDSDPAAEGQDLYRAILDPTRAGSSTRSWIMRCNLAAE